MGHDSIVPGTLETCPTLTMQQQAGRTSNWNDCGNFGRRTRVGLATKCSHALAQLRCSGSQFGELVPACL